MRWITGKPRAGLTARFTRTSMVGDTDSMRFRWLWLLTLLTSVSANAQSVYLQKPEDALAIDARPGVAGLHGDGVADDADALQAAINRVQETTGEGIVSMYRQEGAVVVDPGAKMNPSTYELLAAIHSTGTDEVVVLPNSANVVMAAERAALTARTISARVTSRLLIATSPSALRLLM